MSKILHISQADGGVAVYLQMLLKHLNKDSVSNSLICAQQFVSEDFKPLVEKFYQIEMTREISPVKDCKAILRLRRLIKEINPDVVYCHSSKAGALGRIAVFGLGKKIVYNAHGWAFNMKCSKSEILLYKWVEKILAWFTDSIVCISDFEKLSALKNGVGSEKKLQVIYNGVDVRQIELNIEKSLLTRDSLQIPRDAFVVGMVGRISKQKAPDSFVKMAKKVKDSIPNAYFMIVGDGDERKEIESLIQENNLQSSFYITGWVSNPNEYLALLDVGVLLSRWEGFGYALVEYMAAKKPVVATKVDAIPNLIEHGENGLLVEVEDYDSAAEQVIKLFSDSELCDKLKENGYISASERFTIERVAREHEKLFLSL
ncbi:MAG: glycosyltransferase family 4 protein [Bacteroidales bacterium]|nr:glycosyltransferase family 4 protein [Bacteroidales bacterium]